MPKVKAEAVGPVIHCKYDALVDPSTLNYHPKNRNKHPKDQIERLAEIINYQGWRYPIKVSKLSGFVTSGHGRIAAAFKNNWNQVPVVYQDYTNEDQEYADLTADNSIASWAELDLAGINIDVPELGPDFDINMLGIKDFTVEPADKYADKDADAVPETKQNELGVKRGDLYILGNHRLLCGDATNKDDVERLMAGEKADMVYTDPPYGMNLDTDYSSMGSKSKKHRTVIGDNKPFDPSHLLGLADETFLFGADYYSKHLPVSGSWIVWDKRSPNDEHAGMMDGKFGSDFELIWSKTKHQRLITRVLSFNRYDRSPDEFKVHPTQKPVKLHEWFFDRWGKDKTNIVDLYGGSGSTLIACEKTNRKCFGMEIDPHYCSVIIKRWETFTGQKAVQ